MHRESSCPIQLLPRAVEFVVGERGGRFGGGVGVEEEVVSPLTNRSSSACCSWNLSGGRVLRCLVLLFKTGHANQVKQIFILQMESDRFWLCLRSNHFLSPFSNLYIYIYITLKQNDC